MRFYGGLPSKWLDERWIDVRWAARHIPQLQAGEALTAFTAHAVALYPQDMADTIKHWERLATGGEYDDSADASEEQLPEMTEEQWQAHLQAVGVIEV